MIKTIVVSLLLILSEHRGHVTIGGVPVPGATVTFTKGDQKLVTVTDGSGSYLVPDLADGAWTVEVEMLGFTPAKQEITVGPNVAPAEWALKMLALDDIHAEIVKAAPPTSTASTPTTSTPAAGTQTQRAQAGFQRADVREAARPAGATAAAADPAPSSAFANASQEDLNARAADGVLVNGSVNNGAASQFGQAPRIGNNIPGQRSLYNGTFNMNVDTSRLDAQSYSLSGQPTAKPDFTKLNGGFTFGGPLRFGHILQRNYPTFFVGYQRTQNRDARTYTGRMPTELERAGDFSQSTVSTFDPVSGTVVDKPVQLSGFAGGVVPVSSEARALLQLFPLPNFTGNSRYNYQIALPNTSHSDSLQSRLNKALRNGKHLLNGNFAISSTRSDSPNLFQFVDANRNKSMNGNVNWTYRKTPRFTATFNYGYSQQISRSLPYFANKINVSHDAGITGNNQDAPYWGPPNLNFTSGYFPLSDGRYVFNRTQNHSFGYSGFWNHGRHSIQWGADFRRSMLNFLSQDDPRGTFTFTGAATRVGSDPTTGYDFADFLLGTPDASSIAFGNADKYFRASYYDAFVNDDWRVNGSLSLSLVARWEYEAPVTELYNRLVNLDIANGFTNVTPVCLASNADCTVTGGNRPRSLVNPDKSGIQPRLAFAWRPIASSSLIVRGGYGIYRNTNVYQSIVNQMAQQAPLSKTLSVARSDANQITLSHGFTTTPGVTANTFAIDPNFKVGMVHTWQLSVQRDLPAGMQMTALYLGTLGKRLPLEFLPNTYPTGAVSPSGYVFYTSRGNSNRQAGQIQLRRRLRNGFTASTQYTYAKSIDNAPLMAGGQVATVNSGGTSIAQNWLDLKAERARSNFDQRHQLTVSGQYTSGVSVRGGALLQGWKSSLIKEWTLVSSMTLGSGLPQTPVFPNTTINGFTGTVRPDVTGLSVYDAPAGFHLNPAAYRAPAAGQWGNAGRNTITGPKQFSLNASLTRTFRMSDRVNMDLQINATNVLNHVTYVGWVTTVGSAQFGLPSAPNGMRTVNTSMRLRF